MKKIKNIFILPLILILVFSLVACTNEVKLESENEVLKSNQEIEVKFPLTITDFLDRKVTLIKEPKRIVSLAPSTTELLYALGVGDKVVGVTEYDDYPPEVEKVPKVGGYKGANIEAIIAQNPDLILASNQSGKEEIETLENMGIPVLVMEAKNIEGIYKSIKLLAEITEAEEKGEEIINGMKTEINKIKEKVEGLPTIDVFYLVFLDGNWTAGKGTFIDELITIAGGRNIVDLEGWPQYSIEELVKKNPDVIITAPHAGNVEDIIKAEGYKDTDAVKNGNIFVVSDDNIISRASSRLVLGLKEIAEFLHPEVFN
ncbi:ABC transporter substrate-binding protein [Tepidimicrobium xylanilyticum]|uniref:Iron complex transport system substrate-binding protein n=1 Tax=Tepidimicrobium xylanilyticum TaxID=1123352 RepID=A0A1H2TLQ7_9FIRM|nr:ABC transporter substrate-binding protein [Tepidimicrobium xylanilyticum]GMG95912.1 ABC transporter substrate-binding protein [Tepidimicrobium xylanilyticum]SDW44760.1 iron complex transport system substrate-binding protein [Tepidimicrobium xylanilyticum]